MQSGDSLWKISQENHITMQQLMDWNNLQSSTIYAGQTLALSNSKENIISYTVKSGDSLFKIAQKYGTTIQSIKQLNGLSADVIYIGQVLKVQANENIHTSDRTKPANQLADSIISEGKKFIGVPYVWGGSSPSGFDCSGFLNYTFSKVGVSIPRTVITIWNAGTKVSNPNKGDIVFFATTSSGPSHAGIYLGNGQFLHAGTSTGVTISDLNNSYWKQRYLGAKKYL